MKSLSNISFDSIEKEKNDSKRNSQTDSLKTDQVRKNFKDLAFWKAEFSSDKNGEFYIESDNLPDNLTTWLIETIVNTPNNNKV
jgi:hypothetical protein